jgi:hypothetical protein
MSRSPWGTPRAVRASLRSEMQPDERNDAPAGDSGSKPTTRVCRVCKRELPIEEFRRTGTRWRRTECRACTKLVYKEWKAAHPAAWRDAFLRRTYHISAAEYDELFARQNGGCAICGERQRSRKPDGEPRLLHVDHDHRTGQVRALLCSGCNGGLGGFRDRIELLTKAIAYLQTFEAATP